MKSKPKSDNRNLINKFYGIKIPEKKREYVKGGKYGKFEGFNFYIQPNERITKKQRKEFFYKAEEYLGEVIQTLRLTADEVARNIRKFLDDAYNDIELMNAWNEFYDRYGIHISDFSDQFEREMLKGYKEYLAEHLLQGKIDRTNSLTDFPESNYCVDDEELDRLKKSVKAKYRKYYRARKKNIQLAK